MIFNPKKAELGIGLDVVSISRIDSILQDNPDVFRSHVFTDAEQEFCEARYYPSEHYAVRWAIKEAYIKAVNTQAGHPNLKSIEVKREPTPHLSVTGDGLEMLSKAAEVRDSTLEQTWVNISLAHERKVDIACGWVMVLF